MPEKNGVGFGEFTTKKLEDYQIFLRKYLGIVSGVYITHGDKWWCDPVFHYIDLNAGPGIYEDFLPHIPDGTWGSPPLFWRIATDYQLDFTMDLIEKNPMTAYDLIDNLNKLNISLSNITISRGDHSIFVPQIIGSFHKWKYGLVFNDPNNSTIAYDALLHCSKMRPQYDLLINLSASLFKRKPEFWDFDVKIADYIFGLNKKYWYIKDIAPGDSHQWTFLFGTNYSKMFEIKEIGFVRIDTPRGQTIFRIVNESTNSKKKSVNTQLILNI